jgi:dGTPase
LFDAFINDLSLLPTEHAERARRAEGELGQSGSARIVADYIAGMTDRFALQTVEQTAAQ